MTKSDLEFNVSFLLLPQNAGFSSCLDPSDLTSGKTRASPHLALVALPDAAEYVPDANT